MLPTIKCSSCGRQVEISLMGEHICTGPTAERKATTRNHVHSVRLTRSTVSPPPEEDEYEPYTPYNASKAQDKFGRIPPAVDINVASEWTECRTERLDSLTWT